MLVSPADGCILYDEQVTLGWYSRAPAELYDLEIAPHADFISSTLVNGITTTIHTVEGLAEGSHYWRVRSHRGPEASPWSAPKSFTLQSLPAEAGGQGAGLRVSRDLGIAPRKQHKDSAMLCIDGCGEHGTTAWDIEHTTWDLHDQWYCTRASIAMATRHFRGRLSQHYISYWAFARNDPEGDLGHGIGLWPNDAALPGNAHGFILQWAMGGKAVTTIAPAAFTFAQLKTWIDANRPVVVVEDTGTSLHTCIIDGYTDISVLGLSIQIMHWIDPWTAKETSRAFGSVPLRRVHAPAADSAGRSDPDEDGDGTAETSDDSDGDGMVDLDERHRFLTDRQNRDTDDDCVEDKNDVRGYVFDLLGSYSKRRGDLAGGDTLRKELDAHNDLDNGRCDGDEDQNRNGHSCDKSGACEGLDTSNFDGWDDYLAPVWCHSPTPSPTPSSTPQPTSSPRATQTQGVTPTFGPTRTASKTGTATRTGTATPTGTRTRTATPTPTNTRVLEEGCCLIVR